MTKIKFGTDGWRAIIAKEFTTENVARVAEATALWLLQHQPSALNPQPSVVIGYDCRFGGELFAETVAKVLAHHGINVFLAQGFVSTPMLSLGTVKYKAHLGIIITASHNPPSYNGFKLKGCYGGPLLSEQVAEIEAMIPEKCSVYVDGIKLPHPLVKPVDLETLYIQHIRKHFDLRAIKKSGMKIAYDAMYGAGQNVIKKVLPDALLLHCEHNPSFHGTPPEPLEKNLMELSALLKKSRKKVHIALATDGDADRLGLFDSKGNFIDSHHIILLLVHCLCFYKKQRGKVCTAFSTTEKIKKLCAHYGLPLEIVKIGFKYICGIMLKEDVLLGGEESGGIALKGHIPERDGIWTGLTLFEFMAKSGKSLEELIKEVYAITGPFAFGRNDLHIPEELKSKIVEHCKNGKYEQFGKYKVQRTEDLDGWKYYFSEDWWLMIRPSGTEPLLRLYAEAPSRKKVREILKAAEEVIREQ